MVTFTNKAARELKERLAVLVGHNISRRLIVGTFHSVSLRFLQRYGTNIGLDKKITVSDVQESRNVVSKILKALRKGSAGNKEDTEEKQLTASSALNHISTLKSQGITFDLLEHAMTSKSFPLSLGASSKHELASVYEGYQLHLSHHNLLDFDDLILGAIKLLRICPRSVQNVEHVFVDEFQDTSSQQYDLMKLLAQSRRQLTIVGDHDQSIYGFRAADIKNFARMHASFPGCVEYHLKMNYRSSGAIVFAASALIEQDCARPSKSLETENVLGTPPCLRVLQSAKTEADWLAKEIKRITSHTRNLVQAQDIAILVRSASLTLPIEQALQRNQIKYRLTNARKFLERPHIRALIGYLRVVHDERSLAILEVVNIPSRKFGQTSAENLVLESSSIKKSLWQTLKLVARGSILLSKKRDIKMEHRLCDLVRVVEKCRALMQADPDSSMANLLTVIIDGVSYEQYLKQQYPEDYSDRMEDVQEFLQTSDILAENVDEVDLPVVEGLASNEQGQNSLDRLLAALSLMADSGSGREESAESLTISTIHSAKGLEWPVVFIPGVYHGSIPSARAMDTEQDEERRLLYVAMTRAKGLLYMCYPEKNARHESVSLSAFLADSRIANLLESRGPRITIRVMQQLARVLQRPVPDLEGFAISEDTYNDRTHEQLADEDYDLAFVEGKFLKRKRPALPDGAGIGFSTASKVLQSMPPEVASMRSNTAPIRPRPSRPNATGQAKIQAFFNPVAAAAPRRQVSAPPISSTRSRSSSHFDLQASVPPSGRAHEEDYLTVILSSSPECERTLLLNRAQTLPITTGEGGWRDTCTENNYNENNNSRHLLAAATTTTTTTTKAVPVQKKRLGMSRPRIHKS